MGRRNRVRWGPAVLRDVAMTTNNFGMPSAVTGFVGYNFGCMIASDTQFDSRGWIFGVKLSDEDITDFEVLRDVAMAAIFWLTVYGVHIGVTWRILE